MAVSVICQLKMWGEGGGGVKMAWECRFLHKAIGLKHSQQ